MNQRRVRYLQAADVSVFDPKLQLKRHVEKASQVISEYFDDVDDSLDDGEPITKAVKGRKVEASMNTLIAVAMILGFQHASKLSKKTMPALYGKEVRQKAEKRSSKVQKLMTRTTKKNLKKNPENEYALSPERAARAAKYEATKAYYSGMQDALAGSGLQKAWITTSDNPCDACLDNEDDDFIDVDDDFTSGDAYPPEHINCQCHILIR